MPPSSLPIRLVWIATSAATITFLNNGGIASRQKSIAHVRLWVISGYFAMRKPCPLYPQKRTSAKFHFLILERVKEKKERLAACLLGTSAVRAG